MILAQNKLCTYIFVPIEKPFKTEQDQTNVVIKISKSTLVSKLFHSFEKIAKMC